MSMCTIEDFIKAGFKLDEHSFQNSCTSTSGSPDKDNQLCNCRLWIIGHDDRWIWGKPYTNIPAEKHTVLSMIFVFAYGILAIFIAFLASQMGPILTAALSILGSNYKLELRDKTEFRNFGRPSGGCLYDGSSISIRKSKGRNFRSTCWLPLWLGNFLGIEIIST